MIRLQAIGNLGRDALLKQVNGRNVINFSVAHTERFKDGNGVQQERTTWLDCSYWTDRTNIAQYMVKGKQVYVEGQPDVRSYTRQDGTSGTVLSLRVTQVYLLGGNDSGGQAERQASNGYESSARPAPVAEQKPMPSAAPSPGEMSDDLPF